MSKNQIIKEACVETFQDALRMEHLNANRIELCSRLDIGGLTPNIFQIEECLNKISIPTKVMIRCRGGSFNYSTEEIDRMLMDIQKIKKVGVSEIVFGALDEDNCINLKLMKIISDAASPMLITFHKAIDLTNNIKSEIEKLSNFKNIKSILTSGGAATAEDGKKTLKKIIQDFEGKFKIIVAGSVNKNNFDSLHKFLNGREYHGRKIV
jgi:copper homeostasis protein